MGDGRGMKGREQGIMPLSWWAEFEECIPLQRKQDGGETFLGTASSSHNLVRVETCAQQSSFVLGSGLSFDAFLLWKYVGGRTSPLRWDMVG